MKKPKLNRKRALPWRMGATALLVLLAVWLLASHWQIVSSALDAARHTSPGWLTLSVLLMALTFCIAAATYAILALHPLRYAETVLVELATAFANRLLPAGLGGLSLNGIYLYRRKHTPAEATAVLSANNLIGMLAHLILLAGVLVFQPGTVRELFTNRHVSVSWPVFVLVPVAICAVAAVPRVHRQLGLFIRNLGRSLHRESPRKLVAALLFGMALTATYTMLLLVAARAVGLSLGLLQVFIVFSVGMLVGTATPTPGGLVGVEAGLFAGFTVYGVSSADAAAAVLLFRLVSYWLPLVPGALVLIAARHRKLL